MSDKIVCLSIVLLLLLSTLDGVNLVVWLKLEAIRPIRLAIKP